MDAESRTAAVADAPVAEELTGNTSRAYKFIKRAFDIVASAAGLIVLSPLLLVVSALIVLDDPKGPPIFVQTRVGKNGKEFRFYKFRSMVVDAEEKLDSLMGQNEMDGPVFKIRNDPRITRFGRFIRRTSIDELPQLWNVLKGDMSLVGPRPPVPREVVQYSNYQRQRLNVTPGLTCYWQVSGRNTVLFNDWIELDLKYIKEQSVWTDIKLIAKTVGVVFRGGVTRDRSYRRRHRAGALPRLVKTAICFPALLLFGADVTTEPGAGRATELSEQRTAEKRAGYAICKRAFDIVASALMTVICLIPMAVIAVMIVVKDPGSPFYMHKRVGMRGKEISVLKFRTMRLGADALEDMLTPEQMEEYKREFKLHDDPRLIGYRKPGDGERCFGALLRRLSLDELPQVFYNVLLKGDMSFVGPRPVLREELEKYYTPVEQEAILSVKPGITGYWQTHGRSDCTYESGERQKQELYYVRNQGVALDIKILLKTIYVVIRRGGTY